MPADQNTLVVIGDSNPTSIESAHVRELMRFSMATGISLSGILNRAVDNFMNIEAPVYLTHVKSREA
jgi:hypothetical protein